ncbi:MAG: histidine--tRNA ligase [Verrucomicrobia bacterium]|nr:histidine--tRNA ligase [Verrucomicrobiota bacterium]MDA0723097.1 histidine--tRNA ligase [Verrucomicrobiota bacterium]MDA1046734.1 histidine--tRNA ligase [Verrucomicrobiota bacterium]
MFESLPGFREFYPEDCSRRNHLFRIFRNVARTFFFREYDAPVLEPLDLYIEKSGEEIVGQLFHFTDKGDRQVALRPELTPSLARMVASRANSLRRPIKWFNVGEHFRYERPQKGRLRAFYQFNADVMGEKDVAADAELIALLVAILKACGLGANDFRVRLSDRVTWALFLSSLGVSDEHRPSLLDAIDKSERRKPEQTLESIEGAIPGRGEEILSGIEKMKAVSTFDALNEHLVSFGEEGERRAGEWAELLKLLESHDAADCVDIDLSIVRGLAYYTGFVYEAFESSGESRALAGGGRYDHLVKKLSGNVDLPAAGFAIGDVTLTDCLDGKKLLPDYIDAPEIFIVAGENERPTALRDVARLRQAGYSTAYPLKRQAFGKQFKEAGRSGAKFAIVYGEEEVLANKVKIKDLSSGAEVSVHSADLLHNLRSLEESGGIATDE